MSTMSTRECAMQQQGRRGQRDPHHQAKVLQAGQRGRLPADLCVEHRKPCRVDRSIAPASTACRNDRLNGLRKSASVAWSIRVRDAYGRIRNPNANLSISASAACSRATPNASSKTSRAGTRLSSTPCRASRAKPQPWRGAHLWRCPTSRSKIRTRAKRRWPIRGAFSRSPRPARRHTLSAPGRQSNRAGWPSAVSKATACLSKDTKVSPPSQLPS